MADGDRTNRTARARRKRWKPAFLAALRRGATIFEACQAAGIGRTACYEVRGRDPEFRARGDEAEEDAVDRVEAILLDRILHGTEREVFYQDKQCGVIHEYSDELLLAFLRARRLQTVSVRVVGTTPAATLPVGESPRKPSRNCTL
jgi:hypothetical protein